jgi:hypothetical protein
MVDVASEWAVLNESELGKRSGNVILQMAHVQRADDAETVQYGLKKLPHFCI